MFYVYKITNIISGDFYIGKRYTTKYNDIKDDPYMGSGNWIKNSKIHYGDKFLELHIKELICHCKDIKDLNEKEIYHISLYRNIDTRCKNISLGGEYVNVGKDNTKYDHKIYKWVNGRTLEILSLTKNDMQQYLNVSHQQISKVANGKQLSIKGWYVDTVDNKLLRSSRIGNYNSNIDNTIYRFGNIHTNVIEELSQYDMRIKYNIPQSSMSSGLISRNNKTIHGWYCCGPIEELWYDEISLTDKYGNNNPNADKTLYKWINKSTNEKCILTKSDMAIKINASSQSVGKVANGKAKTIKKWSIDGTQTICV